MQGSPPCEVCTAVRHVVTATCKYCVLACATARYCMQIFYQNHSCTSTPVACHTHRHTSTITQKLSLRSSFTPSCSQALKIGLTGITLNTLPIQLDYTSDSAFIHLYRARRHHLHAHTCTLTHRILLIVIARLFLSSFLQESATSLFASPLCVPHFQLASGLFKPRLYWPIACGGKKTR